MGQAKTKSEDRILVDEVRESPVDQWLLGLRRRVLLVIFLIVLALVAWFCWKFLSDRPVTYSSAEDHFKYGSIGSEVGGSLTNPVGGLLPPYWIFRLSIQRSILDSLPRMSSEGSKLLVGPWVQ